MSGIVGKLWYDPIVRGGLCVGPKTIIPRKRFLVYHGFHLWLGSEVTAQGYRQGMLKILWDPEEVVQCGIEYLCDYDPSDLDVVESTFHIDEYYRPSWNI